MTRPTTNQAKRALLDAIKMERACTDCGFAGHPAALSWDHLGDKLSTRVSSAFALGWAWERILGEIAKCEVVCLNCHAIRTAQRGYQGGRPMQPVERVRLVPTRRPLASACGRGHPFDEANTYVAPNGKRYCRACGRGRSLRYLARRG